MGRPQGALAGAAFSLLSTALVVGGQQAAIAAGVLSWPTKASGVDNCYSNFTLPE